MVTRADLDDAPRGAMLYCADCQASWSATHGDYFWMAPDEEFTCDCGEPLYLAVERRQIRRVL